VINTNTINDLNAMLTLRGVTQVAAAQLCGMHPINFNRRYAHATKPGNDVRWQRVQKIMHDRYEIAYDSVRGWHCLTDADKADELRRRQMLTDNLLRRWTR